MTDQMKSQVGALLSQMTREEKIGQLVQAGSDQVSTLPGFKEEIGNWVTDMLEGRISKEEFDRRIALCQEDLREEEIKRGELGAYVNLYEDEKVARVRKVADRESRLGIPLLVGVDLIRGYRTIFPTPLAQSCSWDMDFIRRAALVGKREAWTCGINWVFGPMLDIARDARWGRIVESPGEDPFLASRIAETIVEAYQEEEEDGCRLLATAKHFAAYGAVSGGQDYNTVDISKRTLYDIYFPPFQAAIRAGVGAVMSAFHDLNGIPCTMNRWLLTDVLRGEMGFDGFVVSDAEAVKQCVVHGAVLDEREAARESLLAGGDMDMSSLSYRKYLPELIESGNITDADLDLAAGRILAKKMEYGLFEHRYQYDPERISRTVLSREHKKVALEMGERCAVLLKNDGVLPIPAGEKAGCAGYHILILGELADDREALMGPWAFTGDENALVTIVEGMRQNAPEGVEVTYIKGFGVHDEKSNFEEALEAAKEADYVVAVAGETAFMSGEASSRANLHLAGVQEEFLLRLSSCGKPVTVVLVNGRPLSIGTLKDNSGIGGILEAWHLGTGMGHAVARILYGAFNPCGKLTVTFANEAGQEPMYYNHFNTGKPGGFFKFTSRYQDVPVEPLYPFGYGLSYTSFSYQGLAVKPEFSRDGFLEASANVRNEGDRFGEEIVQLYVQDVTASLVRPVRELKGFQKIALCPGEEKKVSFRIPASDLGFFDEQGEYILEEGIFRVFIGPNSAEGLSAETRLAN